MEACCCGEPQRWEYEDTPRVGPDVSQLPDTVLSSCPPPQEWPRRPVSAPTGKCKRPNLSRGRRMRGVTGLCNHYPPPPQPLGCGPFFLADSRSQEGGDACRKSFSSKLQYSESSGFQVPSVDERREAIGSNVGLPFILQRVMRFAEVWFEPIPEPRVHDWLCVQPELMQTFDAFKSARNTNENILRPTGDRQCIHLLHVGRWDCQPNLLMQLRELIEAFFRPLRVAFIRNQQTNCPNIDGDGTLDANDVLAWMKIGLRSDSVLTLALTMSSLHSNGVPTIGASDWDGRVAVLNVASCTTECGQPSSSNTLSVERVAKVLLHQATHMFGILHCCYYRCLMNGASTMQEADSQPPYLCGMCLKKLHLVLGFDVLDRYRRLACAWGKVACHDTVRWYETRVAIVRTTLVCRTDVTKLTHGQNEKSEAWEQAALVAAASAAAAAAAKAKAGDAAKIPQYDGSSTQEEGNRTPRGQAVEQINIETSLAANCVARSTSTPRRAASHAGCRDRQERQATASALACPMIENKVSEGRCPSKQHEPPLELLGKLPKTRKTYAASGLCEDKAASTGHPVRRVVAATRKSMRAAIGTPTLQNTIFDCRREEQQRIKKKWEDIGKQYWNVDKPLQLTARRFSPAEI